MTKNLDGQDTLHPRKAEHAVSEAYMRYNAALLTMSAHLAADLELTLSEMVACEHLRLDGPLTPRELGQRVNLSSGAITPLVDRLEARGFARRKPHPSDRRSVLVSYLPQEMKVVRRMYNVLGRFQTHVENLSEGERVAIADFLTVMADVVMEEMIPPKK